MQSIREKLHTRLNSWLNGKQVKKQSPSFHPNTGVKYFSMVVGKKGFFTNFRVHSLFLNST